MDEGAPDSYVRPLSLDAPMNAAHDALARLQEGNRRFVAGTSRHGVSMRPARRNALVDGQEPFAIVLGCSDARVPAELVFDQGVGDLFGIRVAGNTVGPLQMGSVELAACDLGTRLVVVLGHSGCHAVRATLGALACSAESPSPNIRAIVDAIRPAVEPLVANASHDVDALMRCAVRANIQASVNRLRSGSQLLADLVRHQGLLIVGAEYALETGVVTFFDAVPVSEPAA